MGMFAWISFGPMEMCIVGAVMLLLFGNRLPGTMRSLGQSIVSFKQGMNEPSQIEESAEQQPTEVRS